MESVGSRYQHDVDPNQEDFAGTRNKLRNNALNESQEK